MATLIFCSVRLISLAAQKFISEVAMDALQHSKRRSTGQSARKSGKVISHTVGVNIVMLYYIICRRGRLH